MLASPDESQPCARVGAAIEFENLHVLGVVPLLAHDEHFRIADGFVCTGVAVPVYPAIGIGNEV